MAIYAVHLSDDDTGDAIKRLCKEYPGSSHYPVSERFYLVASEGISQDVARTLGFTSEIDSAGAVFKLNAAYSGWDSRAMWEWLAAAEKRASIG